MLTNCSVIKTITTNLFIKLKLERVYCDLGLKQASFFKRHNSNNNNNNYNNNQNQDKERMLSLSQ